MFICGGQDINIFTGVRGVSSFGSALEEITPTISGFQEGVESAKGR